MTEFEQQALLYLQSIEAILMAMAQKAEALPPSPTMPPAEPMPFDG